MKIETLKYFKYIAKYKNITKASKHFYISQSTLSRRMMALEKELGVTLFIRDNKKLELTEAGKALSKNCSLFLKHLDIIIKKTQLVGNGKLGNLRILTPGNINSILPQSLHTFKNKFPDTQLVIESYNFNEITSAILYELYDIGFTYEFATYDNKDIESITVGEDDFSIVVSSSQIHNDPSKKAIANIVKSLPLILPSYMEPPFIKLIQYELQTFVEMKCKDTVYLNTTDSVMLQVSLGLGYSIVPTSLTRSKISNDKITYFPLSDFSDKGKKEQIVMLYKKSNPSNRVSSFVKIIKEINRKS